MLDPIISTFDGGNDPRPSASAAPPARAPSPAPHLTAPPASYVPAFLGSYEGIEGDERATGGEKILVLLGSGKPVARAPRDSEPGGWLSDEEDGARHSSSPPAVSGISSLTLKDALSKTPRAKAEAVAASVEATVGGRGGGGDPARAVSPPPPNGIEDGDTRKKTEKKKNLKASSSDGLLGGEASWWAAAAGSIYPQCPPLPDPMPTEAALWKACMRSCMAAAEAEPLLAPHILR